MARTKRPPAKVDRSDAAVKIPAPSEQPSTLSDNRGRALLYLILLLAACLCLYRLGTVPRGFYCDEGMDGNNAREVLETGHPKVFYPENNGREGLYINLATPFVYLLGNTIWAMRLPSALFGILTVWVVYMLGANLFSTPIGLLAAFFTATSTWHMHSSRLTNRANAVPFFLTCTLYLVLEGFKRLRTDRPYALRMALAGAVYGLGFHTYIAYRVTPLLAGGVFVYYFFRSRRTRAGPFWKASGCFAASAAAVASPLVFYFASHPDAFLGRSSQVSVFKKADAAGEVIDHIWQFAQMFFLNGDPDWRQNFSGRPALFWPVAIFFATGIAIAVVELIGSLRRRAKLRIGFRFGMALGWIATGALPVILSVDPAHSLRASLVIPPVFLLSAVGAKWIYDTVFASVPQRVRAVLAAGLLVVLCGEAYHSYFELWAKHIWAEKAFDSWLVDAAGQINAAPQGVPKYIAIPMTNGDMANGIPVFLQTAAYLTRTYTEQDRGQRNIHYVVQPRTEPYIPGLARSAAFCAEVKAKHPEAPVFCLAYLPDLAKPAVPVQVALERGR